MINDSQTNIVFVSDRLEPRYRTLVDQLRDVLSEHGIPLRIIHGTKEGWVDVPIDAPLWWEEPAGAPQFAGKVAARTKPPKPEQTRLPFDLEQQNVKERIAVPKTAVERGLVATLF
jgi:hypothetical protein